MLRALPLLLIATAAAAGGSDTAFAPGQRWSCVTDQGADAYLDIEGVEGEAISFSWGVADPDTNELTRLCNKRDALSVEEMSEFCQLLGDEISEGHVLLRNGCKAEASQ